MTIGERIKKLRLQSQWNQKQLAEKLNISQQVVSNVERDVTDPSLEDVIKISHLFNVPVEYLVLGQNEQRYFQDVACDWWVWFDSLKNQTLMASLLPAEREKAADIIKEIENNLDELTAGQLLPNTGDFDKISVKVEQMEKDLKLIRQLLSKVEKRD